MPWLAGLFLIAHGILHVAIWVPPSPKDVPFDAHHSPLFGDVRGLSTLLGVFACLVFVACGVGYLAAQQWWAWAALVGAALSIILMLLTFTPWWLAGLAIDVVVAVLAWRAASGRT